MAIFKCKMCGGALEIEGNQSVVTCKYCGSQQTLPKVDDEKKLALFNRANNLRIKNEFDKAAGIYESIIAEFPEEAEAYWGLVLCKYGIEYVDDPASAKKVPTCHRTLPTPIMRDEDFQQACENADISARGLYREEAKAIDEIQKKILEIAATEKPYDIFICYKETDDITGVRTEDSTIAQDIYTALTEMGYKVFFARNSLRKVAGTEYEPYIYAALSSAKIMLAIGTKYDYYDAVWVKNEWSRFISMMANDSSKVLIPCFKNMDAYDIPVEFSNMQALDMGDMMFFNSLEASVKRVLVINKPSIKETVAPKSNNGSREIAFKDGYYIGEAVADQPNGYGTRVWTDKTKYEGAWKFGKMDGQGTYFFSNGDKYEGEFINDIRTGKGTFYHANGEKITGEFKNGEPYKCLGYWKYNDGYYNGEFVDGKRNGKGTYTWNNSEKYEGEWVNDKRTGKGTFYYTNGEKIIGEFKDGTPHNCSGYWKDNNGFYKGEFVNGIKSGKGIYVWNNGDKYDGEWKYGTKNGQGVFHYANGEEISGEFKDGKPYNCSGTWRNDNGCYKGSFVNGIKSGKGTFVWKNNEKYEGDFVNDKGTGTGAYYFTNGKVIEGEFKDYKPYNCSGYWKYDNGRYEGSFVNGKRTGNGTYTWKNGEKYEGEFVDNKLTGKGIFYYTSGNRYEGEFKDGLRNGKGTNYYTNGEKITGEFKDDKPYNCTGYWKYNNGYYNGPFVDGYRTGKGIYVWNNGEKYDGEFLNDTRTGTGTYYYENGDRYEGSFLEGKRNGYGVMYFANGAKYEGMFVKGCRNGEGTFTNKDGSKWKGFFNDKGNPWNGRGTWYKSDGSVIKGVIKDGKNIKSSKIVITSLISIILVVAILSLVIKYAVIIPNEKYDNAVSLMEAGKVVEAYEALTALDGYNDSEQLADSLYFDYKVEKLKAAKVGEYIMWGTYEQDNDTTNGEEEIEWLVLDKKGSKTLVISKLALDCQQYNYMDTDITWEECTLRTWLNDEFLNDAFTDEEIAMIPTVTVPADVNPDYETDPGKNTKDKVFILSETEAEQYLGTNDLRRCSASSYAIEHGAYDKNLGGCWWWLRSPGSSQNQVGIVESDGRISSDSSHYNNVAVRPSMWIEIG